MTVTTEYEALLERSQRNFALCVLQIQAEPRVLLGDGEIVRGWREKADRLQWAMKEADLRRRCGQLAEACATLKQENEPR
jgi:hypothetical protein